MLLCVHTGWCKRDHFTFKTYILNQCRPLKASNSSGLNQKIAITRGFNCVSDGTISADSWTVQKQPDNTRSVLQQVFMALDHPHVNIPESYFSPYSSLNTTQTVQRWRESFSEINNKTITYNNLLDLLSSKDIMTVAKALLRNAQQAPSVELLF